MGKISMRVCISFLLLFLLAAGTPSFAAVAELPSDGLEQRIDFWKKVYTQYGKDDIVIHDTFHVNLVYDVANEDNVAVKTAAVRSAIDEIRDNLTSLENLGPAARLVYTAIAAQGIPISAATLNNLEDTIHTQRGIKERFRDGVVRSGRYVEQFRGILEDVGVPAELALLPLVESSFQNVQSKAGAVGVWQFMRTTGRDYLKISGKVDERLDPVKATRAAARLLRDNYSALGEWPLAITAYNHGRGGMLRAQKAHGSDLPTIIKDYRGPVFGYASMNFYAEFLAAVDVYQNYPVHFGDLVLDRPDKPGSPATIQVASVSSPKAAAPAKAAAATKAKAKTAPATAAAEKYKVRSGDTLYDIARRFGTTIRSLMDKNNLSKPAIYAGQMLLVK